METSKRVIPLGDFESLYRKCDQCGKPATTACTDAIEAPSVPEIRGVQSPRWTESGLRFGCADHPVSPMVYFLDGREVPFSQCQ